MARNEPPLDAAPSAQPPSPDVPPFAPGRAFSHAERACTTAADCAFLSIPRCACAPCGRTWLVAANKTTLERVERERKREDEVPCPPMYCVKCPELPSFPGAPPPPPDGYVGDQAACLAGQCTTCAAAECAPEP